MDFPNQVDNTASDIMANGMRAYTLLKSWLDENQWDFAPIDAKDAFKANYRKQTIPLTCFFQIRSELNQFIFYAVPNFDVSLEKRLLAAEYLSRVNSGLRIGNFEIDFISGQIRFKSSLNFINERLTKGLITGAISPALDSINTYLPGLVNVLEGRQTPVRAINSIDYK